MDPWQVAMRRGDFATAWAVSDALLARHGAALRDPALPRYVRRYWDGRALDGLRVLVDCQHGLGDTLQFVRLLPLLRPRVRRLLLRVQPALLPLLDADALADTVLPLDDTVPPPPHDALVELMELPHILRLQPWEIPPPGPLRVPTAAGRRRRPSRARLEVGLCWAGGSWDPARNLPPALLHRLSDVGRHGRADATLPHVLPAVRWWSLQLGQPAPAWSAGSLAGTDLRQQAGAMQQQLDLVLSVDTMTAHLAASLGLPTWLLLPAPCDWRWMDSGDGSPWYPTMRLFRQPADGRWEAVLERIAEALVEPTALNGSRPPSTRRDRHDGPVNSTAVAGRPTP